MRNQVSHPYTYNNALFISNVWVFRWQGKTKDSEFNGLVENGIFREDILCRCDFVSVVLKIVFSGAHSHG
jgi:hypothetical protein